MIYHPIQKGWLKTVLSTCFNHPKLMFFWISPPLARSRTRRMCVPKPKPERSSAPRPKNDDVKTGVTWTLMKMWWKLGKFMTQVFFLRFGEVILDWRDFSWMLVWKFQLFGHFYRYIHNSSMFGVPSFLPGTVGVYFMVGILLPSDLERSYCGWLRSLPPVGRW